MLTTNLRHHIMVLHFIMIRVPPNQGCGRISIQYVSVDIFIFRLDIVENAFRSVLRVFLGKYRDIYDIFKVSAFEFAYAGVEEKNRSVVQL